MIKRNDLPPLNSLPVFIAVMKTKSYTKAAEQLFMTHSAVSQSIRKLEAYLDKKLFITDKRKLIITDLAREYYAKIEPLIAQIHYSTEAFKKQKSKKLSINCMTTLCANWLIPKLDELIEFLADTEIQLITLGRKVNFDYDDVDISIEYGIDSDFNNKNKYKLAEGELILVCNNRHTGKSCLEIISQQKLIYVDDKIRIDDYLLWQQHNNILAKVNKKIVFKNSLQAIKACFSGIGFFVTDKLLIQEYIKNGFLYVPPQQSYTTGKSYYLLAKDSETENFDKIKGLLTSYFK
ncbi:transcriptional regulator [Francisella tularensis subsp. novicida GA99-3548]|uniref:LysR family transcriptional regulator n=1 Tax=Francisella tularensis TaxID=263 RepID=UPI000158B3D1|nr:LysR family transcriptional regulator [Francisella tularensis]AJI73202.1 bacterial regulatory helix-turn-helix, lysR family protein [Francisella tularensis subsp. novicida D9876]APA83198.1 Glycine cleavage system transcriptional activator [Francisella tularensis subsp. novicida PA10-7858]EDN37880.1 transcriptional regulator [Francisella tularensis subsp. novicida GA99-3548]